MFIFAASNSFANFQQDNTSAKSDLSAFRKWVYGILIPITILCLAVIIWIIVQWNVAFSLTPADKNLYIGALVFLCVIISISIVMLVISEIYINKFESYINSSQSNISTSWNDIYQLIFNRLINPQIDNSLSMEQKTIEAFNLYTKQVNISAIMKEINKIDTVPAELLNDNNLNAYDYLLKYMQKFSNYGILWISGGGISNFFDNQIASISNNLYSIIKKNTISDLVLFMNDLANIAQNLNVLMQLETLPTTYSSKFLNQIEALINIMNIIRFQLTSINASQNTAIPTDVKNFMSQIYNLSTSVQNATYGETLPTTYSSPFLNQVALLSSFINTYSGIIDSIEGSSISSSKLIHVKNYLNILNDNKSLLLDFSSAITRNTGESFLSYTFRGINKICNDFKTAQESSSSMTLSKLIDLASSAAALPQFNGRLGENKVISSLQNLFDTSQSSVNYLSILCYQKALDGLKDTDLNVSITDNSMLYTPTALLLNQSQLSTLIARAMADPNNNSNNNAIYFRQGNLSSPLTLAAYGVSSNVTEWIIAFFALKSDSNFQVEMPIVLSKNSSKFSVVWSNYTGAYIYTPNYNPTSSSIYTLGWNESPQLIYYPITALLGSQKIKFVILKASNGAIAVRMKFLSQSSGSYISDLIKISDVIVQ